MDKHIPWDLLISHLKNETNSQQEGKLTDWRSEKENDVLYLELVSLWNEIQKEAGSYHPDTLYYWKQLESRIGKKQKDKKPKPVISLRKFRIAVAAAIVLLAVSVITSYFVGKELSQPATNTQTYTALNGKSQMILPDGSTVWLNRGSTLVYQTSFLRKRIVKLDGEALFDVRKDEKHPFVVHTNEVSVKVLGTRFNVQAYPRNTDVRVALLDGKVVVSTEDEEVKMMPGEIALFSKKHKTLAIEKDDVAFESFWANNSCTFKAKPLGYICKYLEKWYGVNITLDSRIADSHVYTFTITDEPLETILQIMARINPVQYSFEEDNHVIIKKVEPKR